MNENQNNNELNNNIDSINQVVTPIEEVKIEQEKTAMPSNDNSPNNNKKNSNKSMIIVFLLFGFFFAYIMCMPYIRSFIQEMKADTGLSEIEKEAQDIQDQLDKEEQENKNPIGEEEKLKEITCTSKVNDYSTYNMVQIQKFAYNSKNEIITSENTYKYTFSVIDDNYNLLKKECDENSLKYLTHEGYSMACSYNDTNIEINHEFDLEIFTPIVDGTTNIKANATYKNDINTLKSNLVNQGYTCE